MQSTAELPRHAAAARARYRQMKVTADLWSSAAITNPIFGRARGPTHPPGSESGDALGRAPA